MNIKVLAAAAALISGVAVPAQAALASAPTVATPTATPVTKPATHVVNLHARFEKERARVTSKPKIAGVVPGRTAGRAKAAASAGNLTYKGGPVQHSPHVYLVLWGPNWDLQASDAVYLYDFYDGLGTTPDDNWSTITSQYDDTSGNPAFGTSVFQGTWHDMGTPPAKVQPSDLAAEARSFVNYAHPSDLANAQIVIASQSGTCFSDDFIGSCGTDSYDNGYCAWHSQTTGNLSYTNLPYQPDAGATCGENAINKGSGGTYDGFSMLGGHEYAESVTDPLSNGWQDSSGAEIADKCEWTQPNGDVQLDTGTFAMQSLWDNKTSSCVMSPS